MSELIRIGLDTSKSVLQLHGVDEAEQPVLRRKLRRRDMLTFFSRLAPTRIGMEACGASHYWARELRALGHEMALIPPQYVKPYVDRGKNDAADAEAICEAMSRPKVERRFVAIKTVEQQARQMLIGVQCRVIVWNARRERQLGGVHSGAETAHMDASDPHHALNRSCKQGPSTYASVSEAIQPSVGRPVALDWFSPAVLAMTRQFCSIALTGARSR